MEHTCKVTYDKIILVTFSEKNKLRILLDLNICTSLLMKVMLCKLSSMDNDHSNLLSVY